MSDYLMQLLSHVSTGTESQRGHKQSAFSRRVGVALACALLLLAACGAGAQSATPMSVIASATSLSDGTFEPEQMAVDSSGNVYGESSDTVYKESYANGVYTKSTVVPSTNDAILGLTVDNAGNLYILDASTEMVYKEAPTQNGYTQTVVYSQTAQTSGNAANPYIATANLINSPEGLAQDASGNLYVSDGSGTIYKGTLSGGVYTWNSLVTVSNSTSIATGIAIDSNQNIFVCGQSSGTGTVVWELKYTGSGYTQSTIPSAQIVYQIAVDRADNLYFAAANANAIYKETLANGSYTQSTIFSSGLYNPMGVAVDSNGSLYIGDTENYRLLKVPAVEDFGTVDVGTTTTQTVTFTFTAGGTIQAPKVLTQGATGLDFTDKGTGTCNTNGTSNSYAIGDSCTVVVSFKPQYPGLRAGAVQLLNSAGTAVVATAYLKGTGSGPQVSFTPAIINTVAGTNTGGYSGDGGLATSAKLYVPTGTAVDGAGNLYIADTFNNRIRKVDAVTSIISTVAGGGTSGLGDGGAATLAELNHPSGVTLDSHGNLYIADSSNYRIRRVDAATGIISTVAGNGTQYQIGDPSGDGGAAPQAELGQPYSVALDSAGNLYIADYNTKLIRKVDATTQYITTVAGGGTASLGDGGVATLAELSHPSGVSLDSAGNLWISDQDDFLIRKVTFATPPAFGFATTKAGLGSASSDSPQTATVQNIGNATLSFPVPSSGNNPSIATNFTLNSSASTACPLVSSSAQAAGTLNAGASCTLAVSFEPTAGGSISGSLNLTDDNLNAASATQSLALTGKGVGLSSIAVTPASPGIVVGGTQQFTATGTYSDNSTLDLSTLASWSSSNTTAATITSGLTTGNGVATGLAIGNSNITATLDNVTSNSATLAVSPNVAYAISVYDPYGNSATQSAYVGTFFNSLVVQVTNNAGVGVIGASVTFTSNGTGANAYLWNNTPSTATTFTVTTDANGYATVSYPTANTTVGSYTVSAAVSGVSTTASFNLTNLVMPIYTVTTLVDDASGNYNNCTDQSLSGATPDAACSLRDAIYAANHFAQNNETAVTPVTPALMPTINFASSYTATQNASGAALTLSATTPGTYTLGSGGTLPIYANMNIVGPGAKLLTIDGNSQYLDFFVYSGATVYLSNMAVQGGYDSNRVYANQGFNGQGIDNAGTLSLSGISMSNYTSSCAIDSTGILVVDNSIFDSNSSDTISVIQSRSVNHTAISLNVTNSIFSNNTSDDPGTGAGVIGLQAGIAQISSSTFYGNHTAASGAAIGIAETGHNVMTITNSTFYNNSAGGNGGGALRPRRARPAGAAAPRRRNLWWKHSDGDQQYLQREYGCERRQRH